MALALKTTTGNARLDAHYDTVYPAGSIVDIYSGSAPGFDAAATGALLSSITTPATPWAAAAAKSKAKQGVWQDAAANATGDAGYFRLRNAGNTEWEQGSVSATGGGGDLVLAQATVGIVLGQIVTVNTFTRTA